MCVCVRACARLLISGKEPFSNSAAACRDNRISDILNLEGEKVMVPAHNKQHFQKDLDVSNGLIQLVPNFIFF